MKRATKYYDEYRVFKGKVLTTLLNTLGERTIRFNDSFEDEQHNVLLAIGNDNVFFDDGGGSEAQYPINELGIDDALYILSLIED